MIGLRAPTWACCDLEPLEPGDDVRKRSPGGLPRAGWRACSLPGSLPVGGFAHRLAQIVAAHSHRRRTTRDRLPSTRPGDRTVAVFGYLNHRFVRLPDAIGITAIGVLASLVAVLVARIDPPSVPLSRATSPASTFPGCCFMACSGCSVRRQPAHRHRRHRTREVAHPGARNDRRRHLDRGHGPRLLCRHALARPCRAAAVLLLFGALVSPPIRSRCWR